VPPAEGRKPRSKAAPVTPGDGRRRTFEITAGDAATRDLKTSEAVARDIVDDIVTSARQPGERLPSEAAMLKLYRVSRQSLREGLRLLEVQGIISLKRGPGGGPVVGNLDSANLGRTSTLYYHLAGATYDELLEAWVVTESALAERAARNPDRDAVRKAMEPFMDPEEPELGAGVASQLELARFHAVMASLAQNRVLELNLQSIGRIVLHHAVLVTDPGTPEFEIVEDHVALAKAIAAGHVRKSQALMEDHILRMQQFYRTRVRTHLEELIDWR
jgi:DNA-binding FadR family transcriptional regulator